MHLFKITLVVLLLLLTEASYACSIAPDYLKTEFGSDDVALGNFVEHADKIVLGKFIEAESSKHIHFHTSKSLRPNRKFFFKKKEVVSFRNTEKRYFHAGLDKDAFISVDSLLSFIKVISSATNTSGINPNSIKYGVGGQLSEIYHGADCERFVMFYDNQSYLLFLDKNDFVIAQFAINPESFGDLKLALKTLNSTLMEHRP